MLLSAQEARVPWELTLGETRLTQDWISKPERIMKKNLLALGLICATAFTLTNCSKELENSSTIDSPFEIIAGTGTKTTTDGINTSWTSSDQLSVFYAEAETKNYSSNLKFENVSGNSFKTSDAVDLSGATEFDWYAFYPYSTYNKTPEGVDSNTFGFTTIAGNSQTQTRYNSMAHLAGKYLPLYGVIKNVDTESTPTFTMHHLTSVILIEVTNNSGNDLTIGSASVTAPYELAGSYFINFADPDNVVYTERGSTYVYKTVNLSVTAGTALANGESAKLYLAVKPFTAAAGDEIKVAVNGYEKAITVPAGGVNFKAGRIQKISFNYNPSANVTMGTDWNSIFGTEYSGVFNPAKNSLTLSGTVDGFSITAMNGTSTSGYIKTGDFRLYNGYSMNITAPAGKTITKIVTAKGGKDFTKGLSSDVGTTSIAANSVTWTGSSNTINFTATGTISFSTITIFYE